MSNHLPINAARTMLAGFALTGVLTIAPLTIAAPAQATPATSSGYTGSGGYTGRTSTGDNRRVEDRNAPAPAPNRNPNYDSRCQDQPAPQRICPLP